MLMNPAVTVLMAGHNGRPYLRTAIESILSQTYRDFCFLIVDDGCTDDSREIVRSYHDSCIKLLCLNRNIGQTAAVQVAFGHSWHSWIRGEYSGESAERLEESIWQFL